MQDNPTRRLALTVALVLGLSSLSASQSSEAGGGQTIAALSYVCPMSADAEVVEDKPGHCRKCGMALQPIRLDLRYTCPVHPTYIREKPGTHAVDGRDLVPVTLVVSWACGDTAFLEPGRCPNGEVRTIRYDQRPHGDHNPKHGGSFFMAPDGWHHLEGTYPRSGLFRLYLYNDYSKPLTPADFTATVSILDARDQEVVKNLPLRRGRISNVMEAVIPKVQTELPVKLLARVTFGAGSASAFNFQFAELTRDAVGQPGPAPLVAGRNTTSPDRSAAPATTTPVAAAPVQSKAPGPPPVVQVSPSTSALLAAPAALVAAVDEASLPASVHGLLAELMKRAGEVGEAVTQGSLGDVWLPAMGTKTVALVLESHIGDLPAPKRAAASMATRRIVAAAWDLDAFGDLGNKPKMDQAYQRLAAAVSELRGLYEPQEKR